MTVHYQLPTTADFAALAGTARPGDHVYAIDLARGHASANAPR